MPEELTKQEEEVKEESTREVIVVGETTGMPTFNTEEEMSLFLERTERRNRAIEILTKRALQKLLPTDFHDFNGKPLLQGVAAQRLMKYFGMSVSDWERIPVRGYEIIEGDTANRLRVTFRANFRLGDMIIQGEGMRDTHNLLFGKSEGTYKEIAEIELPNLDRAARTATYRDGISTLLGFKGLTWEFLGELGFSPDKTTGHTYKTGSKGGDAAKSKDAKETKTKIGEMLLEMADGDKIKAANILERITEWTTKDGEVKAGKRELSKLTDNQTPVIYGKAKSEYEKWQAEFKESQGMTDPAPETTPEENQKKDLFK